MQRGYLYGLDGRKLHLRSEHGALNMLLQSCAALIAKQWVWLVDQAIKNERLDAEIIAFVHDELQLKIRGNEDERNHIARRCTECAEEAGRHFKIKIPIEAEYKIDEHGPTAIDEEEREGIMEIMLVIQKAKITLFTNWGATLPGNLRTQSHWQLVKVLSAQNLMMTLTQIAGWLPRTDLFGSRGRQCSWRLIQTFYFISQLCQQRPKLNGHLTSGHCSWI